MHLNGNYKDLMNISALMMFLVDFRVPVPLSSFVLFLVSIDYRRVFHLSADIVNASHLDLSVAMGATALTVTITLRMKLQGKRLLKQHWSETQMPLGPKLQAAHPQ